MGQSHLLRQPAVLQVLACRAPCRVLEGIVCSVPAERLPVAGPLGLLFPPREVRHRPLNVLQ